MHLVYSILLSLRICHHLLRQLELEVAEEVPQVSVHRQSLRVLSLVLVYLLLLEVVQYLNFHPLLLQVVDS
jgi:hypothetical protein